MPADRRARPVLVNQGHGKRLGIYAGPGGDPGAERQQERGKRPRSRTIVGVAEERHAPSRHDAAHLEVGKRDVGHRVDEGALIAGGDEVVAIVEAGWDVEFEEPGQPRHDPSVAW